MAGFRTFNNRRGLGFGFSRVRAWGLDLSPTSGAQGFYEPCRGQGFGFRA